MSELNFIVFNDVIINPTHICWCESVNKKCINNIEYGIKIVVSMGTGCESIYKWFDSQVDRDNEFKYLSNKLTKN
jgi:hypothetical protein